MRRNWVESTLGQAPMHIVDGDRGKAYPKHGDFSSDGHCLFLSATNVTASGFDFSDCQFISEKKDDELRKGKLARNDVVLTTRGTLGNSAYYGDRINFDHLRINSGMVIMRTDATRLLPEFLFGYLRSPRFEDQVKQLQSGVAQPQLPIRDLSKIKMPLPPIDVQRKIVEVFSAYDDLIENNRRRMTLLEESARLLYREWFVLLRFPGHEHTRIVDGVPEGWERNTLAELTLFLKRGITPAYDDEAEGLVINQKCIRDGRVNIALARRQSREVKSERLIQVGDVLVNSTGEGTLGRVAQVKRLLPTCTVDTHVTIVRPKDGVARHYFGLAVMAWESRFSTMGKGATNQTELSPATIGGVEIVMPSRTLLEQFELFAEPLYEQVTNLVAQNEKLRAARDLLLPRFMSGAIVV